MKKLTILSGAGISAESGIKTFRDGDGLWENHSITDVASPEGWRKDRELVLEFYNQRRRQIHEVQPNDAHKIIADLEKHFDVQIITQNIDDLHERAGAKRLIHMHGEHLNAWCTACDTRSLWTGSLIDRPACPACGMVGYLRPDIVWFGEMPYRMDEIYHALNRADLFVSIGTSGAVYPAAGFVREARASGARTLELNMEPSQGSHWFDEARQGPATRLVPAWVAEMLSA